MNTKRAPGTPIRKLTEGYPKRFSNGMSWEMDEEGNHCIVGRHGERCGWSRYEGITVSPDGKYIAVTSYFAGILPVGTLLEITEVPQVSTIPEKYTTVPFPDAAETDDINLLQMYLHPCGERAEALSHKDHMVVMALGDGCGNHKKMADWELVNGGLIWSWRHVVNSSEDAKTAMAQKIRELVVPAKAME